MTKDEAVKKLQKETKRGIRFNDLLPLLGGMKAPQQHRYYNRAGYSVTNLKSLEYDIKQVYGISNADLRTVSKPAAQKTEQNTEDPEADKNPEETNPSGDTNPELDIDKGGQKVSGSGTEDPKTETKDAESDQKVSQNDTEVSKTETKDGDSVTKETVFELAPEEVKKDIKLRERYPFLNEEDTPKEFYTLVGINGRAYFHMIAAREELFEKVVTADGAEPETVPMTKEEIFALAAKAVENFELNIEGEEELEYYKENKEVLGKHPIFEDYMLNKKVNDYKATYLATRRGNLKNYIGRESKKLEGMEAADKAASVSKIRSWEKELALVEERMEMPAADRYQSAIDG